MMQQEYEKYTEEDFKVWKLLYERQIVNLPGAASQAYLDGLRTISFTSDKIPNFEETNDVLRQLTGWGIHVVPGLIDDDKFFQLLSNRKFPSSTWLRKLSQLDYLEEPDMFHDVFGHVPLLTNQPFVDYLQELSKIALRYIENPWAIHLISRIYWFTVEFGLIKENSNLRIYGAGILSSAGETEYSLSKEAAHIPYNVVHIMGTAYRKDIFQKQYFVIDSYEQLFHSTDQIEEYLQTHADQPEEDYAPGV
ncbi:MAG: phenylalanine 4-monooxygenase [Bacteroidota bacterium]